MPTRDSSWKRFLREVIRDDLQREVAARTGITQTTISRWINLDHMPSATAAIQLARGYGVNPVEALVAAGYLTAEEAELPRTRRPDLSAVSVTALVRELARRARSAEGVA